MITKTDNIANITPLKKELVLCNLSYELISVLHSKSPMFENKLLNKKGYDEGSRQSQLGIPNPPQPVPRPESFPPNPPQPGPHPVPFPPNPPPQPEPHPEPFPPNPPQPEPHPEPNPSPGRPDPSPPQLLEHG